ncbi:MAG: hypothetical protein H6765_00895 [Candidatus Peribacteria bacterium]|nr:MAG: hypothetical protein H6765_00895 [Candidatus Peribacteria bacterium]
MMQQFLSQPRPWWIAGPMISVVVLGLLRVDNRKLGMSSPLKTILAMIGAKRWSSYFAFDRKAETWNLWFV